MNFERSKAISMSEILGKLNFRPTKEDDSDAFYIAPWRDANTASLHINKKAHVV